MARDGRISRRALIGGAAAAAGAAALPEAASGAAAPAKSKGTLSADVVVVGAGLSGLTAARTLVAHRRSVLVLEARDRVGGRTLNHSLGTGKVVEVGGQWIGPTQDHIAKLARQLGVKTFDTYNKGEYLFYENGKLTPYRPGGPLGAIPPDVTADIQLAPALAQLDALARTVPLDKPWTAAHAQEWDSQTAETFKRSFNLGRNASNLFDLGIEAVWACEPRDVSLLHVLFYIHSAGNERNPGTFERLTNTANGAQQTRFVGGSQEVSIRAARRLGKRVMLSRPVRRISQGRAGATVSTDELTVKCKSVIVTGPPSLTALIRYEPDLPPLRAQLLQRFPQGTSIKVQAVYAKPFWRERGLAGQITSDTGPIKLTWDNSPPDGTPGVLMGFVEGHNARVFQQLSPRRRRAEAIGSFVRYFGKHAANPRQYIEMNWAAEPWTRGCYVGFTPPGVLLDYGTAIKAPVGRIHWAGAETSDFWNGYMDGAVRSGERAASEALRDL
jgi:monoamine oxidase